MALPLAKKVVDFTRFQHRFMDGDARASSKVGLRTIPNNPAGLVKECIDLLTSAFFPRRLIFDLRGTHLPFESGLQDLQEV